MHDNSSNFISKQKKEAIAKIQNYLSSIDAKYFSPCKKTNSLQWKPCAGGWQIHKNYLNGKKIRVWLLIDNDFPYTPPRIFLPDEAKKFESNNQPHFSPDGFLCLFTEETFSSNDPIGMIKYTLRKAYKLIKENMAGKNIEDFKEGFLSYWDYAVDKTTSSDMISVLESNGSSRQIVIWRGQDRRNNNIIVAGENETDLYKWLEQWRPEKFTNNNYTLQPGLLIHLPEPLVPGEYPKNGKDVCELIRKHSSSDELVLLKNLIASTDNPEEVYILLGAPTKNSFCYGGVILKCPKTLTSQHIENAQLIKTNVNRADHLWIHGRDHDPSQKELRNMKIAVLGCGSIGGTVADLLAQSGVGNLYLIDKETLDWPNISRHILGADSVGYCKASNLAKYIKKSYPHLGEVTSKDIDFGQTEKKIIQELASHDLIISTLGDWSTESFLNDLQQQSDEFPAILYGWTEAHAMAGHAVLIPKGASSCFRCGFEDNGKPKFKITEWDEDKEYLETLKCGITFSPYGAAQLAFIHGLISSTAINALTNDLSESQHHIWIGQKSHLDARGGAWSESFIKEFDDPGEGGYIKMRRWIKSNCLIHSEQT